MKKLISFFVSGIMSLSAVVTSVPFHTAVAESATYTVKDAENLRDFLLSRISGKDISGKSYDLNGDGRVDIFDLCLMRSEILKQPEENNNDTLVVYFSRTGNTEKIAEYLIDITHADSYVIEAEIPYTDEDIAYTNSSCRANKEQNDKSARPAIAKPIESIDSYDVIYLGYPIWWGEEPRIIDTFLESYDFSDKIVVPFCTSASSGNAASERNIANLVPIGNQLEGKRFSASASKESVETWLNEKQAEISDIRKSSENMQYTLIKGGTFQMGSPESEPERSSDEIQHSVTVGDFYMSKTEISQKDYQEIMGENPSDTKGDDLPVTNITWYDAVQYCNKLSQNEGLTPCYTISGNTVTWDKSANGYRLPTEAEWEYSARANTTTPFSFGDYVHNSDANCYNAYGYNNDASGNWVNGSNAYLRKTVPVTQYSANDYGLYNMHGNVAEWVWDWYSEYDSKTSADPTGSESGNTKVVRGGGWNDHPKHIRSAYRGAQPADVGLYSIGIRPVRNAGTAKGTVKSVYSAKAEQKTGKTLIVYFSQTGNTEGLANLIHEMSGVDIVRLERKTPYSSSSNGPVLYGEALDELRAEAVPELKEYPDIEQYDTILLGYCNWWSSIPASVRSFLMHDDFSGKTIIPFCSMGGGRFGQTISAIAKLAPDSVIKEGLEVTYSSYDRAEIEKWLKTNNIN
ncbi:MAG: SUMF1/EgtB/PvdO family nonheme iron enzyme [Ruminococcus sp.]|nr:SUMF1/EgtB/PvdO family nonheme iron enzyme [Ruminococcus sp.]